MSMLDIDEFKNRSEYNYKSNKDIPIKKINAIEISKFRTLKDRILPLGNNLTIISGKNGTMKTTLMGLIAHPFSSDKVDCFGKPLKTPLGDVFKLSVKYDDNYLYNILLTTENNEKIKEKITIDERGGRHRVVVSGHEKGDGNFNFNTSFLNLSRLRPIVETSATEETSAELNDKEKEELKRFYGNIILKTDENDYIAVHDKKKKKTFGPSGENAYYDFNSISSGEDNLGAIFNILLSFKRAKSNGIICFDEIEASLHPSAQVNLIKFLYRWSKENNIQVILTTHSLYIIQYLYLNMDTELKSSNIIIDFISFSKAGSDKNYEIIANPDYSLAYQELTLSNPETVSEQYKTIIYCEDDMAKHMLKSILGRKISKFIDIKHDLDNANNPGTGKNVLISICKNAPNLLYKSNAFTVLDGDINNEEVKKIKDKKLFIRLPDKDFYCIEKRILIYLLELEPNDRFFSNNEILQESIKNQLTNIHRITPPSIEKVIESDTKTCKKWTEANKKIFKSAITEYCKRLDTQIKEKFKRDFLDRLNTSSEKLGLPKIEL